MSKSRRRERKSQFKRNERVKAKERISGRIGRIRWTTRRGLAIIALFAVVLTSGIAATRIFGSRREQSKSIVRPADALNPTREYVYLGSKPIAVEEAGGSSSGCSYSLTPASNPNVPVAGGPFQLTVNTTAGCAWSATSSVSWITFPTGSSGSGTGPLNYTVAASTNPASQTGTVTIATQQFLVTQAGTSCGYSVSTSNPPTFAASGGNSSFGVTAGSGCTWTATSTQSWVTVTSPPGGSGSGSAAVSYTVAQNTGASVRTAMINVADQSVTITQAGSCTYQISATSGGPFDASGGNGTITVTPSDSSCSWTATTSANFITFPATSGTPCSGGICGMGTLFYSVGANPTTQPRSGTIIVAGQTFTVTQNAGCALAFSPNPPTPLNFPAGGATESISVTISGASACSWSAAAVDNWITVNPPTSGTGSAISLTVGQNPNTTPRSGSTAGSITITSSSGFAYPYTVTQDGSICGFQVSPAAINAPQTGGTFNNAIQVTTGSN
ncbi:MAG: BACON domain-containing protein, partial [Blastocatellia bacterium]